MNIPSIQPITEQQGKLLIEGGSLYRLDEVACWLAARQKNRLSQPLHAAIVVFAADHGAAADTDTAATVRRMAAGQSLINRLADQGKASLTIVDVGVADDLSDLEGIEHARISAGSGDITLAPAMSQEAYWEAVGTGEEMASQAVDRGANLLIAGNIGSGHHIAGAAITCALLGLAAEDVLDVSAAAGTEQYSRDLLAVEKALARAQGTPSHDILIQLGGLEIAAMAGLYRAAARHGVPVLLDGSVSAVAALAAAVWDVRIAGWMLASHVSEQLGHRQILDELGLEPLLHLRTPLETGAGAALLLPVLQAALELHRDLAFVETHHTS